MMSTAIRAAYAAHTAAVLYGNTYRHLISNWHDLKLFANEIGAHEFRVYAFDVYSGEIGDAIIAWFFSAEDFIGWLMDNNDLKYAYEAAGVAFMVDMYGDHGERLTNFDLIC